MVPTSWELTAVWQWHTSTPTSWRVQLEAIHFNMTESFRYFTKKNWTFKLNFCIFHLLKVSWEKILSQPLMNILKIQAFLSQISFQKSIHNWFSMWPKPHSKARTKLWTGNWFRYLFLKVWYGKNPNLTSKESPNASYTLGFPWRVKLFSDLLWEPRQENTFSGGTFRISCYVSCLFNFWNFRVSLALIKFHALKSLFWLEQVFEIIS